MRLANESQQADWLMPPMLTPVVNSGTGQKPATGPSVFAVTTAPIIIDLTSICGTGGKASVPQGNEDWNPNPAGHYITIQADGDDLYYCFGSDPTTIGTISITAVSTLAANQASAKFTATGTIKLPNNSSKDFKLPIGSPPPGSAQDNADVGIYSPARYLAVRSNSAGSACYIRIYQSSP